MSAVVLIAPVAGVLLALAWGVMSVIRRGPVRPTAQATVALLGGAVLALIVFLAGDDDFDEGSRWNTQGAQEVTALAIAGALLAGILALISLRAGGSRRVPPVMAAAASAAAFGGLWLLAVIYSINLS